MAAPTAKGMGDVPGRSPATAGAASMIFGMSEDDDADDRPVPWPPAVEGSWLEWEATVPPVGTPVDWPGLVDPVVAPAGGLAPDVGWGPAPLVDAPDPPLDEPPGVDGGDDAVEVAVWTGGGEVVVVVVGGGGSVVGVTMSVVSARSVSGEGNDAGGLAPVSPPNTQASILPVRGERFSAPCWL